MVSNQFGTNVKCVRSDNAFELGSRSVQSAYLLSKGIVHKITSVVVPQQKNIVERKHKNLLKTSRALMFQSKLQVQLWYLTQAISHLHDPTSYKEAVGIPEWKDAMKAEFQALEYNNTWAITNLPQGKKLLSANGCLKLHKADGMLDVYNVCRHGVLDEDIYMMLPPGMQLPDNQLEVGDNVIVRDNEVGRWKVIGLGDE
ncbi:uncharacterized protein LOC143567013 [Bidens hawaiensis]|uniref:uncharacterized protein LOC143567013 n=1 Tax=Bidens hawaiensis TaxID=980011 RepID=UPI00404B204B